MSADLRTALTDLAAGQSFHPDPATWDRGRRARRRSRVVAGVVALGVVAVVAGVGALVTGTPEGLAPADHVGSNQDAVPAELHLPPERLVEHTRDGTRWMDDLGTSDLAIGRGSVAYLSQSPGLPVVVDAVDGTSHLLDLPGWVGNDLGGGYPLSDGPGLALSPDGRRLAWAYGRAAPGREDYSPVECGIRVADLATGEVTDFDLRPLLTTGQALVAHTLVWSPDSSIVGWRAKELRQWNASGAGTSLPAQLGALDLTTGAVEGVGIPAVERAANVALAVEDTGELIVVLPDGRIWPMGSEATRLRTDGRTALSPVAALSPDGTEISLGSVTRESGAPFVDLDEGRLRDRPITVYADGVLVQPLGWVDERHVAALVTPTDDPVHGSTPQLVVMTSGRVPSSEASWRIAAHWDVATGSGISVAVDLLGLGEGVPGVTGVADFPEPDWPWSDERIAMVVALGLLVAVLGGAFVVRRTRRRR